MRIGPAFAAVSATLLAVLLAAVPRAQAQDGLAQGKVERDITYATAGGVALKLDLYFPAGAGGEPAPVAVYLHGGGWRGGSKAIGGWMKNVTAELLGRGYVVAAVDYRLVPDVTWPAFFHDVKAAVRFLRASAGKYHLDPDRVGTWGTSAGGHLAALLGTTDAAAGLEGDGGNPDQSSRVQAVVDLFGPTDLPRMRRAAEMAEIAFGGTGGLKQASPVEYVSRDDPPFLIIQGDSDRVVPAEQSEFLHERLRSAGALAKLVIVKNGSHGLNSDDITPTRSELVKMIGDFFDQHLRWRGGKPS
jgi:acetyl esterase/lipase